MDVRRLTDENAFMENFRDLRSVYEAGLICEFIDWLKKNDFIIQWETNDRSRSVPRMQLTLVVQHDGEPHSNINIVTDGKVRVHTRDRKPPFDNVLKRLELVDTFSRIVPGICLKPSGWKIKIESRTNVAPYFELKDFGPKEIIELHNYINWYRDQITCE